MTFEEWIRTQIELHATPEVRFGLSQCKTEASIMSWSDKMPGTWFWRVSGNETTLMQFIGPDDN